MEHLKQHLCDGRVYAKVCGMKKKAPETELKFEHALKRLEEIVEEMEAGEVSLDDLLKKYEEGVRLAQFCQAKLGEAQQRIELLTKGKGGETRLKPFDKEKNEEEEGETVEDSKDSKLF